MMNPGLAIHLSLLTFLSIVYIRPVNAQTSTDVKNLYTNIFTNNSYNKHVRPIFDQEFPINVSIDFHLSAIIEFDVQNEKLTTSGYLQISWEDCYLKWIPFDYKGLSEIFLPQDNVWKPDVALKNSYSAFTGLGSSFLYMYVDSNGTVTWYPYMILQSTCNIDTTYIPFDVQTCSLEFVAWSYEKTQVLVQEGSQGVILDEYEENSEWTMVSTNVDTVDDSSEATVIFQFKLRRKPLYYVLYIIAPVVMLSFMSACTFVLPTESGERAAFSVTAFLALAVFLTIVTDALPHNSDQVSYIGIYLEMMTALSTLVVIISLFELRLNSRDALVDPIPIWLIKFQLIIEFIRCSRRRKVHSSANNPNIIVVQSGSDDKDSNESKKEGVQPENTPSKDKENPKVTWTNICNALDFVLFWLFCALTALATLSLYTRSSTGAS